MPGHTTSNLPEIRRTVRALGQTLNLRRRAPGGRLGDILVTRVAEAIVYRSLSAQTDPTGRLWARLSRRWLAYKARHGFSLLRNVMTEEMLTVEQVRGHVTVSSHLATMTAGLDSFVQMKVSAAEQGGPARPARPFMDIGKEGEQAVNSVIEQAGDDYLKRL